MAKYPATNAVESDDPYDLDSYVSGPAIEAPAVAAPDSDPYDLNSYEPDSDPYNLDSYASGYSAPKPERTLWDETKEFAGDSVLDLANGTIMLGDSIIGLGSLASGGLLNEGMKAIGYRPEEAQQFLSDMQSDDRKRQEMEYEAAKGWEETAKTLITNPALLGGKVVETAPMMLGIMGAAKAFAARAYASAFGAAVKGGASRKAATKVALEASTKAATVAAATAEGAMQSGSSFNQYMNEGMEMGTAYVTSIGSGITTGLTAFLGGSLGKKIGLGDVEAGVGTDSGIIGRFIKGFLQEGFLEEMPQSATEQMWDNYAHERPLMQGVEKAAATGALIGGAAGGGFGVAQGRSKSDPNKPDQTPALFNPTHTVNGQQVTRRGQIVPNMYVNQDGDIVRTPSAQSVTGEPVDLSMDVDAVAEKMKADIAGSTDLNPYNQIQSIEMPTGLVGSQMNVAPLEPLEPNLGEEIQYDAVDDGTMDSQDASQLFTDVMGEDISYAEDRAVEAATAAESPLNDLVATERQKAAGTYKKAHPKVQGFDITIENPRDSERKGVRPDGTEWSNTMVDDYGYIKRTVGADSDPNAAPHQIEQVDVFVKHDADIPADNPVYIVDQVNEDGSFDETKVMMGYDSAEEASERYLSNYADGWAGLKNITEATPEQLRTWLNDPAANDEYAEYLKGTPKRLKPAETAQENAQFFADRVKSVAADAKLVDMPKTAKDADTMVSLIRDYAGKTTEEGWDLVEALDDDAIKDLIGPSRRWDGSVEGYGPNYAVENVGRWVETLKQYRKNRKQAQDAGIEPNDVRINVEDIPESTPAPFDPKDMLARREESPYVYHATFKKKAGKIQKEGLKPLQTSNWRRPDQQAGQRYNEDGGVFAFESAEDAAKWAFKMNFGFKEAVSIIKAKRDGSWEVDPSGDISLQMGKGKSLKRMGAVPASDIVSSTDLDFETSAADRGMTGAEYIEKVAAELEAESPLNPDDMLARKVLETREEGSAKVKAKTEQWLKDVAEKGIAKAPYSPYSIENQSDPRLVRAREGGFDTETPYYIGITHLDKGNEVEDLGMGKRNAGDFISVTPDSIFAETMSMGDAVNNEQVKEGARTIPVFVKKGRTFDYENMSSQEEAGARAALETALKAGYSLERPMIPDTIDRYMADLKKGSWLIMESEPMQAWLKKQGYDSFHTFEDMTKNLAMFNPEDVRSVNAMFMDPTSDKLLARREEGSDSDPYSRMRGVEYSYQVQVESTGQVHTVTADAAETMEELDARIAALEELRACI